MQVADKLRNRAVWSGAAGHDDDAELDIAAAELLDALLEVVVAQEELASLRMPGDPQDNIVKVRALRRSVLAKAGAA